MAQCLAIISAEEKVGVGRQLGNGNGNQGKEENKKKTMLIVIYHVSSNTSSCPNIKCLFSDRHYYTSLMSIYCWDKDGAAKDTM